MHTDLGGYDAPMGNPNPSTTAAPALDPNADNGIMASVSGGCIGGGSRGLPAAETMQGQTATVVVQAEHVGMVRITYRSRQFKHRRSSHWAWAAVRVDRA